MLMHELLHVRGCCMHRALKGAGASSRCQPLTLLHQHASSTSLERSSAKHHLAGHYR